MPHQVLHLGNTALEIDSLMTLFKISYVQILVWETAHSFCLKKKKKLSPTPQQLGLHLADIVV